MEYRTLGRTGLRVSALGFGGAPIGLQGYLTRDDRESETFRAQAIETVRACAAGGVNYFDAAPGYGEGRSEMLIGEALAGTPREQVILATKYPFRPDATPEEYTDGLRRSLERLRTDCVDVLQMHGGVFTDALADSILDSGVLDWVDAMRERKLIRFSGITAEGPSGALERLLRTGRFDVLEMNYSLIYQAACDYQRTPAGIIPLARSLGMGITTMRTTTSGFLQKLFRAHFPEVDTAKLTRLAINYVLSTPEVDCALVGMIHPDEAAANIALARDTASRLDLKALHSRYD